MKHSKNTSHLKMTQVTYLLKITFDNHFFKNHSSLPLVTQVNAQNLFTLKDVCNFNLQQLLCQPRIFTSVLAGSWQRVYYISSFVAVSRRFVRTRPECLHFRLRPTVKNQQTDSSVIFRASDFPDRGSSGNRNATRSEDVQAQMKLRANPPPGIELSPAKPSEKTRRSGEVNSLRITHDEKKKKKLP